MVTDRGYTDPRLAALYDGDNAGRHDHDLYLALAAERGATGVLDLGCGTGVFTVECAERGMTAVGVDPAAAMLDIARTRPGGERVTWIEGYADAIPSGCADAGIMSGHAAQEIVDDADWLATLRHLHRGVRPGGWLAFESRNPETAAWLGWNRENTFSTGLMGDEPFEEWLDVTDVSDGKVTFDAHKVMLATGEDIVASSTLRFRTAEELVDSLHTTGFSVEQSYGFWDRRPLRAASPELILVARRLDVAQ